MNRIMEAGHGLRGGQPHPLPEMAHFHGMKSRQKNAGGAPQRKTPTAKRKKTKQ